MKGSRRSLEIRIPKPSPKRLQRSQTALYKHCPTPKDQLRGKIEQFMDDMTLQVESLEDALKAEQQMKEKYEAGLRQ
jgi:hypothetical protein